MMKGFKIQSAVPSTGPSSKDLLLEIQALKREVQELRRGMEVMAAATNRIMFGRLDTLYAPKDVAAELGVSHMTVLNWIREGKMPTTAGKRISGYDLELFLQNHPKYQERYNLKNITGV